MDEVPIEITDEDSMPSTSSSETRPLFVLLERLISNDTKSNTVLTDAQILVILENEFDMDIKTLHELEREIFIRIIKKFLKTWPQWNVFDRIANELKKKEATSIVQDYKLRMLEQNYRHLKDYLGTMIETAKPTAKDAANKLKTLTESTEPQARGRPVLEVLCSRKMLNSFIYSRPNPAENNSIFNLMDYEPYKLNSAAQSYTFTSMLNWYGVRLSIELPFLQLTRYTTHELKHKLVNDANGIQRVLNKELDVNVYMKTANVTTKRISVSAFKILLYKISEKYHGKIEYDMLKQIFNVIKNDMKIDSKTIEVPGSYKQHSSKYPYVRKLCAKVDSDEPSSHNLYIEETVTPVQDWHIGKLLYAPRPNVPHLQSWLKFECVECDQKFNGVEFLTTMREHFKVYHQDEPDWACTNCEKVFSMAELTDEGWWHKC